MSSKKHIVVAVTNDIATDQRVLRTCMKLSELGFRITIIGRKLPRSLPVPKLPYQFIRMRLLFNKGPLFYAEYNLRLFGLLLSFKKTHIWSNDLDTLLPCFLASRLQKNIELIYDAHEYYTGVPELTQRPLIQKIWKTIEKNIVPQLDKTITVNQSIADLYNKEYNAHFIVIRNIGVRPKKMNWSPPKDLPKAENLIILQGAGINIDRGAEEAVLSMKHLEDCALMIVGSGDALPKLEKMVEKHQLQNKVFFYGKKPYLELLQYTQAATVGLSLDKDTNINYRFSLPNKIFDYIHCNTAVVASNLVEIKHIVDHYEVGEICESHDPKTIALTIKKAIEGMQAGKYKSGFERASKELTWSNESNRISDIL